MGVQLEPVALLPAWLVWRGAGMESLKKDHPELFANLPDLVARSSFFALCFLQC